MFHQFQISHVPTFEVLEELRETRAEVPKVVRTLEAP